MASPTCLYCGQYNDKVQHYAFDILALDGDGLRKLPLHLRKTNPPRLLARRADGIHVAPFERGEFGPELFQGRLRDGSGRHGVEAPRQPVPCWAVAGLGQGEEAGSTSHEPGKGCVRLGQSHAMGELPGTKAGPGAFTVIRGGDAMGDQLGSAMATIFFAAVLLVLALFNIERVHKPSPAEPGFKV